MQRIGTIIVLGMLAVGSLSSIGVVTAEGEDLPDLTVTYVQDRLGGLVLEGNTVRERHFTSVTVQNVGAAPAGRFFTIVDVDPADHCHDSIPDVLVGDSGSESFAGLAAGAPMNVTVVWSIVPTPVAMEVYVSAYPYEGEEGSRTNNGAGAPMESTTPFTVQADESACDAAADAVEDALAVVWSL